MRGQRVPASRRSLHPLDDSPLVATPPHGPPPGSCRVRGCALIWVTVFRSTRYGRRVAAGGSQGNAPRHPQHHGNCASPRHYLARLFRLSQLLRCMLRFLLATAGVHLGMLDYLNRRALVDGARLQYLRQLAFEFGDPVSVIIRKRALDDLGPFVDGGTFLALQCLELDAPARGYGLGRPSTPRGWAWRNLRPPASHMGAGPLSIPLREAGRSPPIRQSVREPAVRLCFAWLDDAAGYWRIPLGRTPRAGFLEARPEPASVRVSALRQ